MPPDPTAYLRAIDLARARGLAIEARSFQRILAALESQAATFLAAAQGADPGSLAALNARLAQQTAERWSAIVAAGRRLRFDEQLVFMNRALGEVLRTAGVSELDLLLGQVRTAPVSLFGAFEGIGGGPTWKTVLPQYATRAVDEVNGVILRELAAGGNPDRLARLLRPFVRGSLLADAAGIEDLTDLRSASRAQLAAARPMVLNARRIAFSELHNARHEATVGHYLADPLVIGAEWRLALNRGSVNVPDVCDFLATADLYGLGPGVYPVQRIPKPPHPYDRCRIRPKLRDVANMNDPKPPPPARIRIHEESIRGQFGPLPPGKLRSILDQSVDATDFVAPSLANRVGRS